MTECRSLPTDDLAASHLIADHIDQFFRAVIATDDALRSPVCMRYITGAPHPFGNLAVFSRTATPEDVTRDAAALCEEMSPSAIMFLDEGRPEQLEAAASLGFLHAESMPLMSVTSDQLRETAIPDGYTCREVGPDEAEPWAEAVSAGYGLPLSVGTLLGVDRAASQAPGCTTYFAAEHEGQMVATSIVYRHDGLTGVYGVSTLPEHRGKGLAAHLTAEPLRAAWDLGYTTGVLQASEMGEPVYTRLGFHTHGHMSLLVNMPG